MKVWLEYGMEAPCIFAAEEWKKYAVKVFSDVTEIECKRARKAGNVNAQDLEAGSASSGIYIGLPRTAQERALLLRGYPENSHRSEAEQKDVICIWVKKGAGFMIGSTPGAVLIAVYRFLRECGCRFLQPGTAGEYLVSCRLKETAVELCEAADYDIRGIAIEGACSYENVLDMIDFGPKVGLNVYQFQFKESFVFFERWYDHLGHPQKEQHCMTPQQTGEMVRRLSEEVKKRGMRLYTMGHGWNTEPLGLPGIGWQEVDITLPEETRGLLARVSGVRGLVGRCPLRTNLCYSNPLVQKKVVDYMVEYAVTHPEDDVILFSLSDSSNHCCECDNCADERVSDWMVQLLNRVDERFTAQGIQQKIAFDAYYDTMWCPVRYRLKNPDRFLLEFAPITRAYHEPYPLEGIADGEPKAFVLNQLQIPQSTADNLAYLKAWQRAFEGGSYVAEYHFMWAHYADPGYQKIAGVLHEDIRRLRQLKLEGMIMYQPQRCAMPTAIGIYVLGQTLWNCRQSFDEICEEYFEYAFGADGKKVRAYLEALSERFGMLLRPAGRSFDRAELLKRLEQCTAIVDAFRGECRKLAVYNEYLTRLFAGLSAAVRGDKKESDKVMAELTEWLWGIEDSVQGSWDIRELTERLLLMYEDLSAN